MQARDQFIQTVVKKFGALPLSKVESLVAPNLISPIKIKLSADVLSQAKKFVAAAFSLRQLPAYQKYLRENEKENLQSLGLSEPGNNSIAMSYDFHVNESGQLKLIEINTNAAFLALSNLMYEAAGVPSIYSANQLRKDIEQEMQSFDSSRKIQRVAIIDDQPEQQRLFLEFLVYQEQFKSWGWQADIVDFRKLSAGYDFIYNRYTDFYFKNSESAALKEIFNKKSSCVSPNPVEYFYLADKGRMILWSQDQFLEKMGLSTADIAALHAGLPRSWQVNTDTMEEIWPRRKQLFFKPQQAFGSKQTYRGSSISSKVFEELLKDKFIAQEYVAAPEIEFASEKGPEKFKYDLRVYAYQGQVQQVIARTYQGQVTNLQTTNGGFACVEFQ